MQSKGSALSRVSSVLKNKDPRKIPTTSHAAGPTSAVRPSCAACHRPFAGRAVLPPGGGAPVCDACFKKAHAGAAMPAGNTSDVHALKHGQYVTRTVVNLRPDTRRRETFERVQRNEQVAVRGLPRGRFRVK